MKKYCLEGKKIFKIFFNIFFYATLTFIVATINVNAETTEEYQLYMNYNLIQEDLEFYTNNEYFESSIENALIKFKSRSSNNQNYIIEIGAKNSTITDGTTSLTGNELKIHYGPSNIINYDNYIVSFSNYTTTTNPAIINNIVNGNTYEYWYEYTCIISGSTTNKFSCNYTGNANNMGTTVNRPIDTVALYNLSGNRLQGVINNTIGPNTYEITKALGMIYDSNFTENDYLKLKIPNGTKGNMKLINQENTATEIYIEPLKSKFKIPTITYNFENTNNITTDVNINIENMTDNYYTIYKNYTSNYEYNFDSISTYKITGVNINSLAVIELYDNENNLISETTIFMQNLSTELTDRYYITRIIEGNFNFFQAHTRNNDICYYKINNGNNIEYNCNENQTILRENLTINSFITLTTYNNNEKVLEKSFNLPINENLPYFTYGSNYDNNTYQEVLTVNIYNNNENNLLYESYDNINYNNIENNNRFNKNFYTNTNYYNKLTNNNDEVLAYGYFNVIYNGTNTNSNTSNQINNILNISKNILKPNQTILSYINQIWNNSQNTVIYTIVIIIFIGSIITVIINFIKNK